MTVSQHLKEAKRILAALDAYKGTASGWYALLDDLYEALKAADEKKSEGTWRRSKSGH